MQRHASLASSRLFSGWTALVWVQPVLPLHDVTSLSFRVQAKRQCCDSSACLSFTLQVAALKQNGHRETIYRFSLVFGRLQLWLHACVAHASQTYRSQQSKRSCPPADACGRTRAETPTARGVCALKTRKPWSDANVFVFPIVRSPMRYLCCCLKQVYVYDTVYRDNRKWCKTDIVTYSLCGDIHAVCVYSVTALSFSTLTDRLQKNTSYF